ncbi:MAG: T9SS type A sorting domain-containing protein [Bacteroidia bacterium]|nr:T9SS type A sorting domain-containing protein [Bacteroidia bacterium]
MRKKLWTLAVKSLKVLFLAFLIIPQAAHSQIYCKNDGVNTSTRKLWIERFDLGGGLSNTSGDNSGYADFSSLSVNAQPGSALPFTIETGRLLSSKLFYARIYADLNTDGDFTDANEIVFEDTARAIVSGTINLPANTPAGSVRLRVTVKRLGFAPPCNHYFLGETEDYTVDVNTPACLAEAGTLTASSSSACLKGGSTTLQANPGGNSIVPPGYQTLYVLTQGTGLVIQQVNSTPSFNVTTGGLFTIHTLVYNPATLNLGIVVPGVTTGFDVNALLVQGGGSICASLDVAGAPIHVNNPDAGTLTAVNSTVCGNGAVLSAIPDGNSNVPAGYSVLYVLTSGTGLVIEQVSASPSFTVSNSGLYTIHTLVYDSTLNLGIVVPGVTTGFDVNALLVQGGGSICASLDVAGAPFQVNNPDAGTLTAVNSTVCGNGAVLSAIPDGNSNVPAGYSVLYVLTSGTGLVIEQVSANPSFTVSNSGLYTIHTLVYDSTLNLGIVVPGVTTGFDVNALLVQGGGSICASLDVAGAPFQVNNPDAGTLTAVNSTVCGNGAVLSAIPDGNSNVPAGYSVLYVLTSGTGLVIEQVSASPSFTVSNSGLYTIHTLVYDSTLNLGIVVPGVTTGFDVNALLVQGGGSICASLDVTGASFQVSNPDAGDIDPDQFLNCLVNGSTTLTGIPAGNSNIPAGYQVLYVLTRGLNLVIQQVNVTPNFTVNQTGLYRIHTLVYDPASLNLGIVVPGVTTGLDVNALLVQGGGTICASLDVNGAPFLVFGPIICNLFGISNNLVTLPQHETQLTEEAVRLAENSMNSAILLSSLYPNPATENISVNYIVAESGSTTLSILNALGQNVVTERFNDLAGINQKILSVSDLESGQYLLRLENNGQVQSTRIQIVR